jgi:TetR/AcrR family transcriptional regulator, cholesterol catabolism regulator
VTDVETGAGRLATQEARRRRVIEVALRLGAEGGYEAVQMRDVAAAADVALATLYRYFASKDQLLAEAMAEWTGELQERLARRGPAGDTPADQLVDVLRRACRALERKPLLGRALVQALASPDPTVAASVTRVGDRIRAMAEPILADLDSAERVPLLRVVEHVWHSTLSGWAAGRLDISQVGDELEQAVRVLLRK